MLRIELSRSSFGGQDIVRYPPATYQQGVDAKIQIAFLLDSVFGSERIEYELEIACRLRSGLFQISVETE